MTILSFCDPKTAMVTTKATVAEAIHVMLACQVGAVAIVDEKNCVAGIFTERDVMTKFALSGRDPADTLTRDLMTTPVHTASNEITPSEALTLMMERNFRHLPIVDSRGTLLGILSLRGLLQHRTEELTHELDSLEAYFSNDSIGG
ncbi:MAG TPA: CBS domain-containing protein [Terriglobales bacterium]|nr:CBS domain-containing protein [Terriglobales bacterium]